MFRKFLLLIIFYFWSSISVNSKSLNFDGLSKLNINDLQSIISSNIYDDNLDVNIINQIIKELSLSDLIYDVSYEETENYYNIVIEESSIIENIYINENTWIKDDLILQNLESKNNYFLIKNKVKGDIDIIKNIYKAKGFQNISVISRVEKYSEDRVNLIFYVSENNQQTINSIKFIGNYFYSYNYLSSFIKSQSLKFYNIFKTGSNLNYATFEFDKNKILAIYKDQGFINVKVSYSIEKSSFNNNILYFFIDEGERAIIKNTKFNFNDIFINDLLNNLKNDFNKELKENKNFYSKDLINKYIELFNQKLISNNIFNSSIDFEITDNLGILDLTFIIKKVDPIIINKINISGNSITKNHTIRSKILIQPGEYFNNYMFEKSIKTLKNYPYINDVQTNTYIKDQLAEITIKVDEETNTGNILLAGTFNADTGAGLTFGIEDKNIFGSGNSVNSNFSINSEDLKFDINYKQYPLLNPNLTNTYTIFNRDQDYTSSFGYKASSRGLGYSINFNQSDKISIGLGANYERFKGHSAVNTTSSSINDNIGNFENYNLKFSVKYDTTNNYFNPTNGTLNKLDFTISPKNISDNSYYKIYLANKNYKQLNKSKNFIFLNNKYGYARSLDSKLKTINAFGLGGLNFKGFDYKGIGPYDGNIYLGGNEFFTSTIGYGSSFIFDDKDNINVKFFLTTGSIWNSDYSSSSRDFRSSIGTSFDFITPVGPISFSYASPIEKNNSDKTRPFNFSIGTSF